MDPDSVRSRIAVDDSEMVPMPGLFWHGSTLHGQAHVARVLVHALRLIAAVGCVEEAPRLWAAVYLHLDPKMLRHPESRLMVGFAQHLFDRTDRTLVPGAEYSTQLWAEARRLAAHCAPSQAEPAR